MTKYTEYSKFFDYFCAMNSIPVLYQDEHIIVVNKPVDIAVHKNKHMAHDAVYLTKLIGDQCGQWVYNVHRLDAKTSGVIVLTFSSEMAKVLTQQFEHRKVSKTYLALVKGMPGNGEFTNQVVDRKKKGKKVNAFTAFETLGSITTDYSSKGVDDIVFSLLQLKPTTGRWHQLRQHCSQQRYDIIGDTQHGDWTLNRLVTEKTKAHRLCLHASKLAFEHPFSNESIAFEAPTPEEFTNIWYKSKKA